MQYVTRLIEHKVEAGIFFTVMNLTDDNSGFYHINGMIGHSIDPPPSYTGPIAGVYQTYQWQVTIGY
jgi:hypothetical protein